MSFIVMPNPGFDPVIKTTPMNDGVAAHFLSNTGLIIPRMKCFLNIYRYECKKDFFDIKEGMIIYAHFDTKGYIIDSDKWGEAQPIHTSIFNEHFDLDAGLIPFSWFETMTSKSKKEYLNNFNKRVYYE